MSDKTTTQPTLQISLSTELSKMSDKTDQLSWTNIQTRLNSSYCCYQCERLSCLSCSFVVTSVNVMSCSFVVTSVNVMSCSFVVTSVNVMSCSFVVTSVNVMSCSFVVTSVNVMSCSSCSFCGYQCKRYVVSILFLLLLPV